MERSVANGVAPAERLKARIAAAAFTELMPSRDVDGLGAGLAAQLVAAALGLLSQG